MKRTKTIAFILTLAMALSLAACGGDGTEQTQAPAQSNVAGTQDPAQNQTNNAGTFKIGVSTMLSGSGAIYGEEGVKGVELALEYINANGGFNGATGEYIVYDEQSKTEEAVKIAQKFIQTENVNAVIASNSSSSAMAAAPYYEEAGILTMPMGNSPALTQQGWNYIYRVVMNNDFTVPMVEDQLVKIGYTTVAIAKSQDDNGLNAAESFKAAAAEDGIQVVAEESFASTDTDFSGQCAKIVSSDPQCVFMSVSGDANGTFIKQLRSFGYTGLVFSKESMSNTMIDIAGEEAANYVIFSSPYVVYANIDDCDIPNVRSFLDSYVAKYGSLNTTDICYRGWDSVMTFWEAAKIAGSNDTEALKGAIDQVKFDGLGGPVDFSVGDHEGYHDFNSFIEIDRKNLDFDNWLSTGGYDEYKATTGNAQ